MATCNLCDLRELVGDDILVIRLLAEFGGCTFHFPKRPDVQSFQATRRALVRVVGEETAERLRKRYAGQSVRLPFNNNEVNPFRRDRDIYRLLMSGFSIEYVCRNFVYAERPTSELVRNVARSFDVPIVSDPSGLGGPQPGRTGKRARI